MLCRCILLNILTKVTGGWMDKCTSTVVWSSCELIGAVTMIEPQGEEAVQLSSFLSTTFMASLLHLGGSSGKERKTGKKNTTLFVQFLLFSVDCVTFFCGFITRLLTGATHQSDCPALQDRQMQRHVKANQLKKSSWSQNESNKNWHFPPKGTTVILVSSQASYINSIKPYAHNF